MTTTMKPVKRETLSSERDRGRILPIIVELNIKVRLKGRKHAVTVTYAQLWTLGNKNAAEDRRRQVAENRKRVKGK